MYMYVIGSISMRSACEFEIEHQVGSFFSLL